MKIDNITQDDLHYIRHYIYNGILGCEGYISSCSYSFKVFTEESITQYICKGLEHYEQLVSGERELVNSFSLEFIDEDVFEHTPIFTHTRPSTLILRLLHAFKLQHNYYTCSSLKIPQHKVDKYNELRNTLKPCTKGEDTIYKFLNDDYKTMLYFLYALGIQM